MLRILVVALALAHEDRSEGGEEREERATVARRDGDGGGEGGGEGREGVARSDGDGDGAVRVEEREERE